jgi:hypothetical protein
MDVSSIVVLQDIELIPVLKFEPFQFAAEGRSPPFGFYERMPEEWHRHWVESLADSGIRGVMPVERGSWHVPTSEFTDLALLRRVLEVIFQNMEEAGFSIDLDCLPLLGGLALRQSRTVLIEPGCCADLGAIARWREAVGYRQAEWQDASSGHPSVSVRYDAPRLIISSPHQGEPPTARWAVHPDQLQVAVVAAEFELDRFASQVAAAMPSGFELDPHLMGQKLAGLAK